MKSAIIDDAQRNPEGGMTSPRTGFTPDALPEVQPSTPAENPQTGVSTSYVQPTNFCITVPIGHWGHNWHIPWVTVVIKKTVKFMSFSKMVRFTFQNGAFCVLKWCILQCKMVRFAKRHSEGCILAKICLLMSSSFTNRANPLTRDLAFKHIEPKSAHKPPLYLFFRKKSSNLAVKCKLFSNFTADCRILTKSEAVSP